MPGAPFLPSAARSLVSVLSERPDAEAVVARSGRLTYRQLDDLAQRCGRALQAAGVRPGDRLAVSLVNDLPLVALFHAAMRLGVIWVGVNRALAPPEKAYILRHSETSCFIGDATMIDQVRSLNDRELSPRYLDPDFTEGSEWSVLSSVEPTRPVAEPDPWTPAAIAYTSGTTGFPKGAVHSQYNLMLPGAMLVAARGYGPSLRKADCFPFTILNLQVLSTLLIPQCGGTAIVMDRVDPVGIAEWIAAERPSTWNGAPAMLYGLAANPDVAPQSLASLAEVWTGGGHCPRATAERFVAKFGRPVHSSYGSTEVPTVVTIAPRGPDTEVISNGPPLPHLRVHIMDEAGQERPRGSVGEICVGPAPDPSLPFPYRPMLGYWKNPEATAVTWQNGLLHTGDIGFLDDRGFLVVHDRRQSLIVRGGANVYPAEVERVINEYPGVGGSCVVGIPDERLGARIVAVVELDQPDAVSEEALHQGLAAHCRAALARYKVPERFLVRALPRNAMGKVNVPELQRSLGTDILNPQP